MKEWSNPYNSFNSWKGLLYAPWYQVIRDWKDGKVKAPLPPVECSLDPIQICQLKCSHCNASRYLENIPKDKMIKIPDESLLNLVEFLGVWGVKAVCFTGNTKVKLVNGVHKTFKQLTKEWDKNKLPFEVYSRDKKGNIVPGIATNPRITRQVTELIEITLDNKKKIKCTPDHKFMLKDGSYKEAKNLTKKDSLMPLYTKILSEGYEFIMDSTYQGITHKLFSNYWFGESDKIVHHKNFKKLDNTKNNLQLMTNSEHIKLHAKTPQQIENFKIVRDKWNNSEEGKRRNKKHLKKIQLKYSRSKKGRKQSKINLTKYNKSDKGRKKSGEIFTKYNKSKEGIRNSLLQFEKYNSSEQHLLNNKKPELILLRKIGKVKKTLDILKEKNLEINEKNWNNNWFEGLTKWDKAKNLILSNHKIISKRIIKLDKPIDVYCMNVNKYHNFALSSGVFVQNCFGGGGEPTLHPKLADAIFLAKQMGMDVSVATNGVAFDDKLIDVMARYCRWVGISVDAGSAATYKKGRGKDCYGYTIHNIKKLSAKVKELGTNCDVASKFLIFEYNQTEIYRACLIAKEIGAKDFHVRPADLSHQGMDEKYKGKAKPYNIDNIKKQFEQCHELEDKNFHVYTIIHKFDEHFMPKKKFTQCVASPCCIQICPSGEVFLCPDQRYNEKYKLGEWYPTPENILNFWGGKKHYELVFKTGAKMCNTRCTFNTYCEQCEKLFISDEDPFCKWFI